MLNFMRKGKYNFLVDGQFGSTGKGLLAAYIATNDEVHANVCVSNAGPNSGHTCYFGDEKIVLKQLPTYPVIAWRLGREPITYLSSGAVINPQILAKEINQHRIPVVVSGRAAVITPEDMESEHSGTIAAVAGTRQGVGAALVRKLQRHPDAIMRHWAENNDVRSIPGLGVNNADYMFETVHNCTGFVEVSQGFSLGINSSFYPKVTSRECTVMQAAADARIPHTRIGSVAMSIRTFPIRVGDFEGHSSGDCYPDQYETTWDRIGVQPELTTVTLRPRRVFSFSVWQFQHALLANQPDLVFVNFMNYIRPVDRPRFARMVMSVAESTLGRMPKFLWGYGPKCEDIQKVEPQ